MSDSRGAVDYFIRGVNRVLHSVYAASALTVVVLVATPFFGTAGSDLSNLLATGTGSSAPVISVVPSTGPDDTTSALVEFVEHSTTPDSESDDGETNDGEHLAQAPESSSSPASTDTTGSGGATGSGDTTGSGGTTGGTGGSTPSPSAPNSPNPGPTILPSTPPPSPASPVCPAAIGGSTPGAPSRVSALGVAGTSSADLQAFAEQYNAIRVANCLPPVPLGNIRYDSCMEDRLFWMAEDPSTDPLSAWGHIGSIRSDGVPSVGCDGNLAGGSGNTGATVAQKWWDSSSHRASLYKPTHTGSTGGVCIVFSMTHGGVPNEPPSFTRAAARWVTC